MNKYLELFKFEFKSKLSGMIMWSFIWILIAGLTIAFYDSLIENMADLVKVLESMPKEFLSALGASIDSITRIEGYVNSRILTLSILVGGVWAGWMGSQMIGKDESTGVMNWLATQPLSRQGIFLSKLASYVIWMIIVNMLIMGAIIIMIDILTSVESVPINFFIWEGIGLSIYYLFMFAIGNFFAVLLNEEKGRLFTVVVVMANFTANIIRAFENAPEFVKYLTTYYYFDTEKFIADGILDSKIYVLLVSFIILTTISLFKFKTKNIGD